MVSALLSRCLILILGTLYPAYRSYKAIKNKDLREHVKWMMYWIVFALFTTLETFLDIFISWFPFYYEIKIIFILWVLSPATRGSSILYKKLVHPMLTAREQEIDDLIEKTKVQGYSTFMQLFTSGFQYVSNLFMNSAMRGQTFLGQTLTQSLSVNNGVNYENNNGQQLRGSKSNDGYFMQNDLIDEDEHDSSDFEQSNEMRRRQKAKASKKSASSSTKSSYDLIDADLLLQDEEIEIQMKSSTNANTKNVAKRRTTKANEASKYGTITRGKSSKSRTTAITHSNDSDQ